MILACIGWSAFAAEEAARKTIPVLKPSRTEPVDFYREVVPVLQANCLPCHNKTTTKADLLLETPADMLKGGESGPAVVPGKAAESLLLKVATHEEKPRMPPKENKVNAVELTSEQLGLLALWIDQGAKTSEKREETIAWQALPDSLDPIFAVTVTADGRYAACGRGNHVDVYRLPSGRFLGRLADASLAGSNAPASAHRDVVNALAFSPDGDLLASGGFRDVKLWRRTFSVTKTAGAERLPDPTNSARQLSPDGKSALWFTNGAALLSDAETKRFVAALVTDPAIDEAVAGAERALVRLRSGRDAAQAALDAARKELDAQRERAKKADESLAAASKAVADKEPAVDKVRGARFEAELAAVRLERLSKGATNLVELSKAAADKIQTATKEAEKAEQELKPLLQKLDSARNERDLAATGINKAASAFSSAQHERRDADTEVTAAERLFGEAVTTAARAVPRAAAGAFSPDSRLVATAHDDGTIRVWDAADASPVERIAVGDGLRAVAFADDATVNVATAAGVLRVGLQPTWTLERTLGGPTNSPFADRVTALAFRPDGRRLATGGGEPTRGGDLHVWNPAAGALLYALPGLHSDTVLALAWSPDGALILSGGADRFARVVDTGLARQVRVLEGHSGHVLGVAWSPDGATLATAGADLVVKLWDARSGEKRKQAAGFGHEVTAVSFLENAQRLVAASGDNELRVLNETGERVLGLSGPGDFTYALAATPDGQRIVAGGQDGMLRVWRAGKAEPELQLKDAAPTVVAIGK